MHWFESIHLPQYSPHFLQPEAVSKNPFGQVFVFTGHFPLSKED